MSNELSPTVQNGLAVFYVLCAVLNVGFAIHYLRRKDMLKVLEWGGVAVLFLIHAGAYFAHLGWTLSLSVREAVDSVLSGTTGATVYVSVSMVAFVVLLVWRKFFV